jgi:hypothetical protein
MIAETIPQMQVEYMPNPDEQIFNLLTDKHEVAFDLALKAWFLPTYRKPQAEMLHHEKILISILERIPHNGDCYKIFDLQLITDVELFVYALKSLKRHSDNSRDMISPSAFLADLFTAAQREVWQ